MERELAGGGTYIGIDLDSGATLETELEGDIGLKGIDLEGTERGIGLKGSISVKIGCADTEVPVKIVQIENQFINVCFLNMRVS